jgi:uncharacterized membrane protein
MKINYFCPCLVKCIFEKLNKKVIELSMKKKDEIFPSQQDVKDFDKIINDTAKKIINTKCD